LVLTSPALVWFQALLADLSSKVCQGPDSPKGSTRFLRITLFSLNQARRLGSLLLPHRAFQGHAAHMARWPVMLSPNGSSDTCMSEMLALIPPCRFTAQRAHRVPVYPRSCDIPPYCFHGAAAHLRRILLMEQQVWSRQRAPAKEPGLLPSPRLRVLIHYYFDYESARIWRSEALEMSRHDR
jgi:hypothetical protein